MKGKYVDGFLLVVPKNKVTEYKKMAELGKKVWMKHGALEYMGAWETICVPKVWEA